MKVYQVLDTKGKMITVTASEEAAELYAYGNKSKYFDPRKMSEREYPGHVGFKIEEVEA